MRLREEKASQRALLQYFRPENHRMIRETLRKAGREDLIGFDKKCLIRPRKLATEKSLYQKKENVKKKSYFVKIDTKMGQVML